MRRGTTPTLVLEMPSEIPVKDLLELVLSIQQKNKEVIEKRLFDMTADEMANALEVVLTQEETLAMDMSWNVKIQVKYKTMEGLVSASRVYEVHPYEILKEDVI